LIGFRFDRSELAGSLGDLGTLLPLSVGLIVLNGLSATSVFAVVGLFYMLTGFYFRTPMAVQPMKAIAPYIPGSVIRGVQLAVGVNLLIRGLELMVQPDIHMRLQAVAGVPLGIVLGGLGLIATLLLLESRRLPPALLLIVLGIILGLVTGKPFDGDSWLGLGSPRLGPYGWPPLELFWWALPVLALPQLPVTIGNAVLANTALAHEYFPGKAPYFLGGMPMCHGAGGLAAHYRFGARTGGSNLIIGGILLVLALSLGENLVGVFNLLPDSILGVLLVFAGIQLALVIQDLADRKDLFVVILMLGLGLAFNLAVSFLAGIAVAYLFRLRWVRI
jgi:SulP family sulfate permease